MYKSQRLERIKRQRRLRAAVKFYTVVFIVSVIATVIHGKYDVKIQSPIVFTEKKIELITPIPEAELLYPQPGPAPVPLPKPTPAKEVKGAETTVAPRTISGKATYYSREGCVGCDPDRIMANGEPLDDSKLTIALTPGMVRQYKLLNKYVTVTNSAGKSVRARVTDTGGFGKYGRIADLSVATREALNCKSICEVTITY